MTNTHSITILLIAAAIVVALVALALYPPPQEPEEGRVLGGFRVEGAQAGFTNTTTFQVDEDYERIGLTYIITEAAHVRAAVTSPQNTTHEADAIPVEDGPDRLELDVLEPDHGPWRLTVRTLDEEGRRGYIISGEFYILGFNGETPAAG